MGWADLLCSEASDPVDIARGCNDIQDWHRNVSVHCFP